MDTTDNVTLPAGTWVDIYDATGITVGTAISIQNLGGAGQGLLQLNEGALEPTTEAYNILLPYNYATNVAGATGAWGRMTFGGKINVGVVI